MNKWQEYEAEKKKLQKKAEKENWDHKKYMEELDKICKKVGV